SFEPNAELLPMLRLTIERLSNVELHSFALSDRTGSVDLFVPEDPTMASLADWTDGVVGEVHHVSCKMERLDDLVEGGQLPVPQFIKCDVEGAEISVFSGALKTLDREDAPILMFELNAKAAKAFGKTTTDYFELLGSLSSAAYSFYDILKDRVSKLEVTDLEYTNILAIPAARSDAVEGLLG
ncbi:MAG: FkbM family methyltransferase, partial [Planctomycetes bacterium]|nr:FkbM family methyltransferase [Planctomycetota bacterium]